MTQTQQVLAEAQFIGGLGLARSPQLQHAGGASGRQHRAHAAHPLDRLEGRLALLQRELLEHRAGVDDRPYGQPSEFEKDVIRRDVPWLTATEQSSVSFTPLQSLNCIITPNGLFFERYHAGRADVDPRQHRLLIHGLVERPLILLTLGATRGNQLKAAQLLGLNRNTLRKKIRELDIDIARSLK